MRRLGLEEILVLACLPKDAKQYCGATQLDGKWSFVTSQFWHLFADKTSNYSET